ncbi:MAG: chromosomal replication initiator protein DnaA [Ruminococcus sp.]|uniref:chromosomal replication initiator protein DnaA n=1 Tax=Ruminococcus sp. TaxID=41978 RepID=UPI0025CD0828|nr:chromosomal replication initiator protein DnaA [Ruminococcus sp.]MCR5540653.1 chromosomal replication initiator protein DnaA [Ruminococcus sp.]
MINSFNDVFEEVLKYCYRLTGSDVPNDKRISESGYRMWIQVLKPYKMENNVAYLLAKSDFVKQQTMTAYGDVLNKAFEEVMGFPIKVDIMVSGEDEPEEKKEVRIEDTALSEEADVYTFDNFIRGSSNSLAYAFCKAVAEKYDVKNAEEIDPDKVFNPLIIYGDSGLGKTHLMKAIEYKVSKSHPELKIIYTTGEAFINELVKALEFKDTVNFHEKYRNADLLLIDDIQIIAGKERMQDEFFHTFNELYNARKQIVLTSDILPSKMTKLQDRISTRLSLGVQADVQAPDFETRMAIINRKAELLGLKLSDNVVRLIAEKLKTNIRQLEGTVKKIKALTMYTNESPSISMAQRVIKEIIISNQPSEITVDRIISEVANAFDVTADDIKSNHRHSKISIARKITIYILKEVKGMTYTQIGDALNKNHSTMTIHYRDVSNLLKSNKEMKDTVDDIIKNLKEK